MSAILRWFDYGGRRHRAWFRLADDGTRELILAGPDWQLRVPDVPEASLEELSDERLVRLARRAGIRPGGPRG